ncbi:MAG: NAD(P)H-binding protein [Myxococcota bacterium]
MKVILFGAAGGLGQWAWKAAVSAGHEVVAFVRSPHKLDAKDPRHASLQVVQGDVTDRAAVTQAAAGCEAAINCTSPAGGNATLELAQGAVEGAAAAGVRTFYMVGGLGALWAPGTERQVLVQDWDDGEAMQAIGMNSSLPREQVRAMTKGHLASMAYLASTGYAHAYMCPGLMVDGPPTESRVVTLDELASASALRVNLGNVAQVIVDDLGTGALLGHRVSVSNG